MVLLVKKKSSWGVRDSVSQLADVWIFLPSRGLKEKRNALSFKIMTEPRLHLVVQLYGEVNSSSYLRMVDCINRNSELDCISKISVLAENPNNYTGWGKVEIVPIYRRASFADCLRVCRLEENSLATHFAIANTDIFLSEGLDRLLPALKCDSFVAAVSRRELDGSLCSDPKYSQDVWVFKSHWIGDDVLAFAEYELGVAGCENLFARTLHEYGYDLWNPCFDCRFVHNDPEPKTTWARRYFGFYLLLNPCAIDAVGAEPPCYSTGLHRKLLPS